MGLFGGIKKGLKKTRDFLSGMLGSLFGGKIDDDFYEELEMALLSADVGVSATEEIIGRLRDDVKEQSLKEPEEVKQCLKGIILDIMTDGQQEHFSIQTPAVITVIGVNGVGKTTSIGKLAALFTRGKKSVAIAAADTFRAAATDQIDIWAQRSGVKIIKQGDGADPAAVVYDAVSSVKAKGTDILIVDTAGRLHNKVNLMEELKKIDRVISREHPQAHRYNFIVLDATTGQNAVAQVKAFNEAVTLHGIILTKLDGTAKGGVVIAINRENPVPVRYVGVGEKIDDLETFSAKEFTESLF